MYTEDFLIRHRQLRESADNVLGLTQSQKEFKNNTTILMYGGMCYGVKSLVSPQKFYLIKRTKLLQSKSKQSRIVFVVCK